MLTPPSRSLRGPLLGLLTAFVVPSLAAQEPTVPAGIQSELSRDLGVLEQKYLSLADVMTEHFAWRPNEDTRSVSEVFTHVGGANLYIPVAFGVEPPAGKEVASFEEAFARMGEMERITDPEAVVASLRGGLAHARHAIAAVPVSELDDEVTIFGQQMTKREGLVLLVTHMHEHLGQAVAYARMNGVVPPWSAGG
ncbi:MAG: DinB family protein [Gemmatimonadota bacterium]|nr:DinB family protein [Gemmatimonadota bacterium]